VPLTRAFMRAGEKRKPSVTGFTCLYKLVCKRHKFRRLIHWELKAGLMYIIC
jgi:hypothetical protein